MGPVTDLLASRRTVLKGAALRRSRRPAPPPSAPSTGRGRRPRPTAASSATGWPAATRRRRRRPVDPGHPAARPGRAGRDARQRTRRAVAGALGDRLRPGLPPGGRPRHRADHAPRCDHTVKVDVHGLDPYTRYWYRFRATGETQPRRRTQTAPDERRRTHALRFALVSCSNYTGGYFTRLPRARGARRPRLRAARRRLHLRVRRRGGPLRAGRSGRHPRPPARPPRPSTSRATGCGTPCTRPTPTCRRRTAGTRGSPSSTTTRWRTTPGPGVRRTTRRAPRGRSSRAGGRPTRPTWSGCPSGCPTSGTCRTRASASSSASPSAGSPTCRSSRPGRTAARRSTSPATPPTAAASCPTARRRSTRGSRDPDRHLLEPEQLRWLKDGLTSRRRSLAPRRQPGRSSPRSGSRARRSGGPAGVSLLNSDQWDGYQADQAELLEHLAAQPPEAGDAVVLTGDIHSSWAMDLPVDRTATGHTSAGVEFVCPSVTSDGFYEAGPRLAPGGRAGRAGGGRDPAVTGAVSAAEPVGPLPRRRRPRLHRRRRDPRTGAGRLLPDADAERRPARTRGCEPDVRPALPHELADPGGQPPAQPGQRTGRSTLGRAAVPASSLLSGWRPGPSWPAGPRAP